MKKSYENAGCVGKKPMQRVAVLVQRFGKEVEVVRPGDLERMQESEILPFHYTFIYATKTNARTLRNDLTFEANFCELEAQLSSFSWHNHTTFPKIIDRLQERGFEVEGVKYEEGYASREFHRQLLERAETSPRPYISKEYFKIFLDLQMFVNNPYGKELLNKPFTNTLISLPPSLSKKGFPINNSDLGQIISKIPDKGKFFY